MGLQPGLGRVLPGQPGHTGFFLPCFFFNSARFQPRIGRVLGRPAGPGRVSKLCFELRTSSSSFIFLKKLVFVLL
jgi:hypothetical protein